MIYARPLVTNLDPARAADDDEQRRVLRVRMGRDHRVAAEGELADHGTVIVHDHLALDVLGARRPTQPPVAGAETHDLHGYCRSSAALNASAVAPARG